MSLSPYGQLENKRLLIQSTVAAITNTWSMVVWIIEHQRAAEDEA